jgi:hypothetical protein
MQIYYGSESVSRGHEGELNNINGKKLYKVGCRLDFWTIKEIKHYKQARISPVTLFMEQSKAYWKDHIRMSNDRIPRDLKI